MSRVSCRLARKLSTTESLPKSSLALYGVNLSHCYAANVMLAKRDMSSVVTAGRAGNGLAIYLIGQPTDGDTIDTP